MTDLVFENVTVGSITWSYYAPGLIVYLATVSCSRYALPYKSYVVLQFSREKQCWTAAAQLRATLKFNPPIDLAIDTTLPRQEQIRQAQAVVEGLIRMGAI